MVEYFKAKPTGIYYKVENGNVFYFNRAANEWRECQCYHLRDIRNHPHYFIKVDDVPVA
nr:MAG: hypothetical protein [Bacteriophage sp.]